MVCAQNHDQIGDALHDADGLGGGVLDGGDLLGDAHGLRALLGHVGVQPQRRLQADDRQHAVWATQNEIDFVSLSFVRTPVEAPDGTAARPHEPSARMTSTSTVGLPRESRISCPVMSSIVVSID